MWHPPAATTEPPTSGAPNCSTSVPGCSRSTPTRTCASRKSRSSPGVSRGPDVPLLSDEARLPGGSGATRVRPVARRHRTGSGTVGARPDRGGPGRYLDYIESHAQGVLAVNRGGAGSADASIRGIVDAELDVQQQRIVDALGGPMRPILISSRSRCVAGSRSCAACVSSGWRIPGSPPPATTAVPGRADRDARRPAALTSRPRDPGTAR